MFEFATAEVAPGKLNAFGKNLMKATGISGSNEVVRAISAYERTAKKPTRVTFTVIGTGLPGAEWPARLEAGGHELSKLTRDVLAKPDYDKNHRLEAGKEYKVTLLFGKEVREDSKRTAANLKSRAKQELGEQSIIGLKGELALLVREKCTNAEFAAMGIYYVAVLHEPIIDSDGDARVLSSCRYGNESFMYAHYVRPDLRWSSGCAFVFLES